MSKSFLSLVAEFHRCFRYKQPEPDLSDLKTNELRIELLREELRELRDATSRVEQLDALCDSQYVLSGAVLAWGYRGMIEGIAPTMTLRKIPDMDAHLAAMFGLLAQMEVAAELQFGAQVLTLLQSYQSYLQQAVWSLGFSSVFQAAFEEVHRSNMSKIWSEDDASNENLEVTNFGVSRFDQTENGWIGRRADGKIVKSPSYSPASLEQFVR